MNEKFQPRILAFLCNWCAYAGADLAGVSRLQYPPGIRVIRTMCSGRVDPLFVVEGLRSGFDSILVSGWHIGECHYLYGNVHLARHLEVVAYLLDLSGIGRARMALKWISAAEGKEFAEYVKRFTDETIRLGPFNPDPYALELAACKRALDSPRLRWLMGMEIQLTEKENVFHEKIEKTRYTELLQKAALSEYEKALISESLGDGPLSVREIALKTGLAVHCVSSRLGELERFHEAELRQYQGEVPLFANSM